ncbi:WD40-repeat-containing domain protein [Dendryphion nanum]|uniref:WD40-repeat-containing domain protein n=1 Tax=Dendryphion nanum TaxID=256645 RepID=A0A9P9DII8_9PLEO|nr:WD40-repeat-containing domain protein [Dendryphion nanum]
MNSRKQFLDGFEYDQEVKQDFTLEGRPAQWASGNPKSWGYEHELVSFRESIRTDGDPYSSFHSTISQDQKLIAITADSGKIAVYDIASRELRVVLEGKESSFFRPTVPGLYEHAEGNEDSTGRPAYTLLTTMPDQNDENGRRRHALMFWDLDKNGRLLDDEEEIDVAEVATNAIEAILPQLEANHEWTRKFVDSSTLHDEFSRALAKVAAGHRRRHNVTIKNANLANFNPQPFSTDGKMVLYHSNNDSTQGGMREPSDLPHLIVYNVDAGMELHRLSGPTDSMMWSGFSPDQQHVASVAWDGKLRMYNTSTGELLWTSGETSQQAWAAAFSPDSQSIVWSSQGGQVIQVHAVDDGTLLSTFPADVEFRNWCRNMSWNSDGEQIVLTADRRVFVWRPFEAPNGTITQTFELKDEDLGFLEVNSIKWLDAGRKLGVSISEGTHLVWDQYTNAKELFKRPKGVNSGWVSDSIHFIKMDNGERDFYITVDGDVKMRYWSVCLAAFPSWWEKEDDAENLSEKPEKKEYPETGKYVNITKAVKKVEAKRSADESGRDEWADKGAELWTAG